MRKLRFTFEMHSPPSWFWLAVVILVAVLARQTGEILISWA